RDMGELPLADVEHFERETTPWIAERMARGEYLGWLVEYELRVVAGGGVLIRDLWPTPRIQHAARSAHVVSIYTEPEHRRRGVARLVMETILGWCAENDIALMTLSAAPDGRALYEQMGFTSDTRAMRRFGAPSLQH